MSNFIELKERGVLSKSEMKQLRRDGKVPAIVYGKDVGSISIMVSEKELLAIIRSNPRAILNAAIPGKGEKPVLVQHIHRDPISHVIIHVDFRQLNMDVSMEAKVTIHFSGSPAGVKAGGVLQVEMYEVAVRCMPDNLLSSFEVDISDLGAGEHLLVSDLSFHEGIEVLSDPDAMLVRVSQAVLKEEPEATGAVADPV